MSNLVLTKKSNVIFLATILILGTFAAISPSFMLGNVQAQSNYEMDRYYKDSYGNSYERDYGNDNRYDSYEPEYTDKAYNNYKPDHYGMDNDYAKKSYGYESEYSSYGEKDDKTKKDDNSKNVSIHKIKCINTNLNINGNNVGNVSIGNIGQGNSSAYSSNSGEYGSGEGYGKQDKGFDCAINNNNNNTNLISNGGGNATNGNVTEPQTCEECFRAFLSETQITAFLPLGGSSSLEEFCTTVGPGGFAIDESVFRTNLGSVGVSTANINALIACLVELGVQFNP